MAAEDFDFDKFAKENGLSSATVAALESEELNTYGSLMLLGDTFDTDVSDLKISVGQRVLLRKALKSLTPTTHADPPIQDFKPVTSKDLQKDKALNQLLGEISTESSAFGLNDLLAFEKESKTHVPAGSPPAADSEGKHKTLFIKDFISNNRIVPNDPDEKELFSGSGSSVFMRSQGVKVRPENVSIAQWTAANMRILAKLIDRGDIVSKQDIIDYMKYTEELGDYFQIYTTPSVMLYDHRYRERQAKENFRWGTPDFHAVNFYLRPNIRNSSPNIAMGGKQKPILKDSKGQNLCRDYQTESGCKRRSCKFSHVCATDGCRENHPEYLHSIVKDSGGR